jgi:DNA gyrase subunit B
MPEMPSHAELIQHVRKRPGMYFMSAGFLGLEHLIYELVGNVLDLYLLGQATYVNVKLNNTSFVVEDDGPGFPFDLPSDLPEVSLASRYLSDFHHTPSRDNHAPHVHVKTWGVGLAPVTAVSAPLVIQSWRNGDLWEQVFEKGVAQSPPRIIKQGSGCGTTITMTPDPEIFGDARPREDELRLTLFETTHLFSNFTIGFQQERFLAPKGLYNLGQIYRGFMGFNRQEPFHTKLKRRDIEIEVALFGDFNVAPYLRDTPPVQHICSWVNGAKTMEHGGHVRGLRNALKSANWHPELMLIHVIMYDPAFAGPSRTRLNVPHVPRLVREALKDLLCEHCQNAADS